MAETTNIKKAQDLGAKVRDFGKSQTESALQEGDLAKWLFGADHQLDGYDPVQKFGWVFDCVPDYSFEQHINETTQDAMRTAAKEAKLAQVMYGALQQVPEESGQVRVALKRYRERDTWTYRVLAIFPEGTKITNNKLGLDNTVTSDNPGITYLKVNSPCLNHASDILYKAFRGQGTPVGHVPYRNPMDLFNIGSGLRVEEFMDPTTRQAQDAKNFVFKGVTGYFGNEPILRLPKQLLEK